MTLQSNHRSHCDEVVAWFFLSQQTRILFPVGLNFLVEILPGFPTFVRWIPENVGHTVHTVHPVIIITKINFIISNFELDNFKTTCLVYSLMVSTSDCHPRGPGFDSRLYPTNFSGTGSTQSREDNWVAIWMRSSEIRLRKLKLRLRDMRFANHKALPPYSYLAATASVGPGSSGL